MVAEGHVGLSLILLVAAGCAVPPRAADNVRAHRSRARLTARPFTLPVCRDARYPERAGVWQTPDRSWAFVYDGCSVRFVDTLEGEMAILGGLRNVARAFVVDVRDYADPFPYFRTRARWDGGVLMSVSILAERPLARWAEGRFWSTRSWSPLFRARRESDLGELARSLLSVVRMLPTEEEIARARGVEMPAPDDRVDDYVRDIVCPTGRCEEQRADPPTILMQPATAP